MSENPRPKLPGRALGFILDFILNHTFKLFTVLFATLLVLALTMSSRQREPYLRCVAAGGTVSYGSSGYHLCTPPAGRRFDP